MHGGHVNLLCVASVLVYVMSKGAQDLDLVFERNLMLYLKLLWSSSCAGLVQVKVAGTSD